MTTPGQLLDAGAGLDLDAVTAALSRGFRVTAGPRETVERLRLDTFDARLRAAGLTLEQVRSGRDRHVALLLPDGTTLLATLPEEPAWPAFADALPEGPVRAAVGDVSTIRALMVQHAERRRVRRLRLRNDDDKLVVRVALEAPVADPSGAATVTVEALRGYDGEGRRAWRLLAALGLRAADEDAAAGPAGPADVAGVAGVDTAGVAGLDTAVEVIGGAGAAGVDRSDRDTPAALLLADELGDFHREMRANLPGLLDDVDTEFLHDFRVAVRRTRATLKLGRAALPDELRGQWEPAFKWLGDLTTPVRDLDVYELELPEMSGWLVGADPGDLAPFAAHVRRRRAAERRALVRGLRSARYRRLSDDWAQTLDGVALGAVDPAAGSDQPMLRAGRLADRQIRRAVKRVVEQGSAITADSPAGDLHSLRKRCKELRYALEVFAPVVDDGDRKRAVADLKGLQDVLGRFQDSEVQRQTLRGFAQEMMTAGAAADAVLAMGELVGHLDAEQDRARDDFDRVFARFVRPASAARLRRLGGRT
jgi:CHAD domain-containing protein